MSPIVAFGLFVMLLFLVGMIGMRFAGHQRLFAFLTDNGVGMEQDADEDPIFYDSIGDAPSPLPAPDPALRAEPPASYTIELGSTSDAKDADQRVKDLSRSGINAFYTPLHREGRPVFRIRVGLFENEKLAQAYVDELKQHHAALEAQVSRL